jgi:hypothetical protein
VVHNACFVPVKVFDRIFDRDDMTAAVGINNINHGGQGWDLPLHVEPVARIRPLFDW